MFQGVRRTLAVGIHRQSAETMRRRIEQLVEVVTAGEQPEGSLRQWTEALPQVAKRKLVRWGLLEQNRISPRKPLIEHWSDWKLSLEQAGSTRRHVALVTCRAKKLIEGCRFAHWSDIDARRVNQYLAAKQSRGNSISAQTRKFYVQAIGQFCRWMCRQQRASHNPLAQMEAINVRADRRHDRRALVPDELRRLLAAAQSSEKRLLGMDGPQRALLYRLATETGLRQSEIRSLTVTSFRLEGDQPAVTIAAAYAKNRREDTLPLRQSTAAALRDVFAGRAPSAAAFQMPPREHLAKMLRADLERSRAAWLEEDSGKERQRREQSDFLAYVDARGRYADFHALRATFVCNLIAANTNPKLVQRLARHGTFALTMDCYGATFQGDAVAAVASLPDFPVQIAAAPVQQPPGAVQPDDDRPQPGVGIMDVDQGERRAAKTLAFVSAASTDYLGIPRTAFTVTGFQDRRIKPLCHSSGILLRR